MSTVILSSTNTVGLQLYPNPTDDRITVVLPDRSEGTLRLFDVTGRVVMERKVNSTRGAEDLQLGALSSGSYVVDWRAATGTHISARVIVR